MSGGAISRARFDQLRETAERATARLEATHSRIMDIRTAASVRRIAGQDDPDHRSADQYELAELTDDLQDQGRDAALLNILVIELTNQAAP